MAEPGAPSGAQPRASLASWAALAVLILAYALSFIDRTILSMVVGPVKAELHLSDTRMSLLTGLAFAIFYTLVGLPIGRQVDRGDRRLIVTAGILVWSLMTALCGAAHSFTGLLLARIGVGAGEATLSPAAYSLIPDRFAPHQRGRAFGLYGIGSTVGSGLAFLLGGALIAVAAKLHWSLPLVGPVQGWRAAFVLVALPGVPIALLMLLTGEPRRTAPIAHASRQSILAHLRSRWAAYLVSLVGLSLIDIPFHGVLAWGASYLIRVHHLTRPQVGLVLGPAFLVVGTAALLISGWAADAWLKRGRRDAPIRIGAIACALLIPVLGALLLPLSFVQATVVFNLAVGLMIVTIGMAPMAIQLICPPLLRGQVAALYMLTLNLIGMGVGPTAVALLTDVAFHDPLAVGRSIGVVGVIAAIASVAVLGLGLGAFRKAAGIQPVDLPPAL